MTELGWRRLGASVMLQAVKDARGGEDPGGAPTARAWLASDGARWLAAALDMDPNSPGRYAVGLPRPTVEQLALPGWE